MVLSSDLPIICPESSVACYPAFIQDWAELPTDVLAAVPGPREISIYKIKDESHTPDLQDWCTQETSERLSGSCLLCSYL